MLLSEILEWLAVVLNVIFLILLIREKMICWPFGIMASLISIFLFYEAKLYSEAVLYFFYVIIGFYAWYLWSNEKNNEGRLRVSEWNTKRHLLFFSATSIFALLLGYYFTKKTDAANAYADAASTSFSFLATYMEAHKILSAWLYWIVLNLFSIWLYQQRGLKIYAVLMILYSLVSFYGFFQWRKKYAAAKAENSL